MPWNFPLRFVSEDGTEEDTKQTILDDFKALKLVRWDVETKKVVCENWETSFDTPLDVYEHLIAVDTEETSSKKRQRRDNLGMLLDRLRLSAGAELISTS